MSTRSLRRTGPSAAALAMAALLAACSDAAPAQEPGDDPAEGSAVAEDSGEGPSEDADQSGDTGQDEDEPGTAAAGGYLDVLLADSLHPDVDAAEPGSAYIEFASDRLDFDDVECRIEDVPDAGVFEVTAQGETALGRAEMRWSRTIGSGVGWAWEDEYVNLSLVGGTAERELNSNSMVTAQRDEGGDTEWLSGSGTTPLVRLVGTEATAVGSFDGTPGSEDPLVGDFVAAVTCP
ncbi:hypothetical protein IM660_04640 [Ruania alkalisoli]|uniref:Lipoprotein n=1 Tax=Ruania alkalisoli TaxID=2779775 RepID=A0A7M1SY79_9MICO|nr:hypothetical protein [Ruania alkalisoli]QOR71583.1 hypothetical protein IM660_04640 [Ruania alkalisoli]